MELAFSQNAYPTNLFIYHVASAFRLNDMTSEYLPFINSLYCFPLADILQY